MKKIRLGATAAAIVLCTAAAGVQAATVQVTSVGAWNNWFQGDATKSVREFAVQGPGDYLFSFALTPDSSFEPSLASLHGVTWDFASSTDFGSHDAFVSSNVAANSYSGQVSFHADEAGIFRFDLGFTNGGVWGPNYSYYDQIWNGILSADLVAVAPPAPADPAHPLPEPAAPAVIGLGLIALAAARKAKRPA